ncbi:hypothetical protein Pla52n_01520 [Stieleria varia]|uniref:Uncharacterized protein n=1 Tax=Stieleria varia TaxID=2528005 RepID=A0A5C6B8G3_9BACT|nr:hypothetical protein Pla52n_01520 [Stieleria varia]
MRSAREPTKAKSKRSSGRRLRVSPRSSPMTRRGVLPWGMHKPGVLQPFDGGQQVQNFGAIPLHSRAHHPPSIHPPYLSACLDPKSPVLQRLTSTTGLVQPLQHSILDLWLAVTQAGSPPARQSDLASPHVHVLVRRLCEGTDCPVDGARNSLYPSARAQLIGQATNHQTDPRELQQVGDQTGQSSTSVRLPTTRDHRQQFAACLRNGR